MKWTFRLIRQTGTLLWWLTTCLHVHASTWEWHDYCVLSMSECLQKELHGTCKVCFSVQLWMSDAIYNIMGCFTILNLSSDASLWACVFLPTHSEMSSWLEKGSLMEETMMSPCVFVCVLLFILYTHTRREQTCLWKATWDAAVSSIRLKIERCRQHIEGEMDPLELIKTQAWSLPRIIGPNLIKHTYVCV